MRYTITCVCKDGNGTITGVGCDGPSYFTRTTVVNMINNGNSFFTKDKLGSQAQVFVYRSGFIKTAADGKWTDNLDNLPLCRDCHLCK